VFPKRPPQSLRVKRHANNVHKDVCIRRHWFVFV